MKTMGTPTTQLRNKKTTLFDGFDHITYNLFSKSISHFLACLILPILTIVAIIFMLIKEVVNIILKLKYGNSFGGILASADCIWAIEDTSKAVINILLIIKLNSDNSESIIDRIKHLVSKNIFQKPEDFPKLTSTRHRFMGYNFLLKNRFTVDDCVSALKIRGDKKLSEGELRDVISECCNEPLPKQHSTLWQILVSPQPVQWHRAKETSNCYPVLLRFSHIVGDGASLTNLMLKTFAEETCKNTSFEKLHINLSEHLTRTNNDVVSKLVHAIKGFFNFVYLVSIAPSLIFHQHFLRSDDVNSLHGQEMSGEKNLVYAVKDGKELFILVKDIKNSIPNCKFSDILFAAISRSLEEHFTRNSKSVPRYVGVGLPVLLSLPNMDQSVLLQNQFTVGMLDLPIKIGSNSMLQRLQKVMQSANQLRNSPQNEINYWILTYLCGFIPHPILKQSFSTDQLTITISNVPGVPKVTIMDDCDIEDVLFFTHHRGKTGVGFSILTYDDRFQLTLCIDKSIMESKDEAQMIVDDIFKYIRLLYAEVYRDNVSTK